MKVRSLFLAALALSAPPIADADQCANVPPRCASANDRAVDILDEIMRKEGAEMADSLLKGYCATLIGIEVNRFCAMEYRKIGLESCAAQIDGQIAAFKDTIPVFESSMDKLMISKFQQRCHWEE